MLARRCGSGAIRTTSILMIEEKIKTKIRKLIARGRTLEGWLVELNNIVRLAIPIPQNAYRQRMKKITDPDVTLAESISAIISAATNPARAQIGEGVHGETR
jgi:hypothetical protein